MSVWKRRFLILAAVVVGFGVLLPAVGLIGKNYLVDVRWFDSLGYGFYYWQRLLYRYVVFAGVTALFFAVFFLNFWTASRFLGAETPSISALKPSSLQVYKDLFKMFRTGSMWIYTPLSLILAVIVAQPLFESWEAFLLYITAPSTGALDPVYSNDISFYLFSYPIYTLLQRRLLIAFVLLLLGVVVLYLLERKMLSQQEQRLPKGAKVHLSMLVLLIFLIEIWDFSLQRYDLLYTDVHLPLFFGGGYTEMRVVWSLIWISLAFLTGLAFSLIYFIQTRKAPKVLIFFAVCFAAATALRASNFLPAAVQQYFVKPNEISREKPFIENNIKATLAAYNLNNVETRNFSPARIPTDVTDPKIKAQLRNIPVWDGELLDDVYKQLQRLRTYYTFPSVDVDRYKVNDIYQQVFLSAREFDFNLIPEAARNWVNVHLSYTHGYGAVMTPAGQGGDEPMTWFLRGIPPESEYGFRIEQPGIYIGQGEYTYVIAPNESGEIDYPRENTNAMANYAGKDGVPVSSYFEKLLFAYYFGDQNIFLTSKTTQGSKIHLRRNLVERIRTLTPYLLLDKDPYLVVTPRRLYWIQDAYTYSDGYPCATPYRVGNLALNYIRNSVKVVVDAYDGSVDYYVFEPADPIIQAYSRIYPGVFKNREQMPADLAAHVRYPQDIFEIQMSMYAKYQQTNPEVFYQQEDVWEFAKTFRGKELQSIKPYYVTLDLIDPGRFDFLLLLPLSPKGRDNLRALAIAGSDPPHYGKIIVYSFPKGEQIFGPSQIHALINQDTKVSEQFTLWDQVGSRVERGKMIILPISNVVLYIQPVYLQSSTQLKIPELKRFIMSQGQMVVMEPSLEEAYMKLQGRIKGEMERMDRRFAPLMPGAPASPQGASPPGRF